ncbi:MAG: RNA-binding protein [Nitriliruptorales bacterium]|nr:RNA-binding protein [Nitriliruptorales bacterium]
MSQLIVDGMNVIGSRPDGWWRDRHGAVRALLTRLQRLHATSGEAVQVVLDGRPLPDIPEGEHDGVDVRYAKRRGADAADDRIVELLSGQEHPERFQVVTADRVLVQRVHALGADALGPSTLLHRLDALDG